MTALELRRLPQRGQVMVLFALAMVLLLGMVAVALDGGYGFVQNRRAQNATDFAAFAGAQELNASTLCNGSGTAPSTTQMAHIVQDVVTANSTAVGTSWQGQFLDNSGGLMTGAGSSFTSASNAGYPPPGACGLTVYTCPHAIAPACVAGTPSFVWPSYLAGIIGQPQLQGNASAAVGAVTTGNAVGIASLNKVGPHTILGGGSGKFVVSGDIFLNTNVQAQPWTQSLNGWQYDDAIDAKVGSKLTVFGTVHSSNALYGGQGLWPLDWCFGANGQAIANAAGTQAYTTGAPPPYPANRPACSVGTVDLSYNHIDPTLVAIDDPLKATGAPPNPFTAAINCPGRAMLTDPAIPGAGGTMQPGEYTTAVHITTSMTFGDCSALGGGEGAYPGIYRFDKGLWIDPRSAVTVGGTNVVLGTKLGYPVAGNVPGIGSPFVAIGAGNGAPCIPNPTTGQNGAESDYSVASRCSGTSPQLYGANMALGVYGKGDNFSLMIGGVSGSTVNLTGPTTGLYAGLGATPGIVLYQDPATQANYGFDALSADAAAIDVTGVVYDASLPNYGIGATAYYWDPGNGIPAFAGGTLQTGYGAGWSVGPAVSNGSVTITGTTIVDAFNTDGATTITIIGKPYRIPGGGALSLIG